MRKWRVRGFGKSGGACLVTVNAETHAGAIERAAAFGVVEVSECVLIQEATPGKAEQPARRARFLERQMMRNVSP